MERTAKERQRKTEDFCACPLLGKIIRFTVPLILTGVLQLLYNAADIIIVGRFAGTIEQCDKAVAAVGATGALINLITNLFLGLSVGALSAMARSVGAKDPEKASRVLHTSVLISIIAGVLLGIAGFFLSGQLLKLMATPDDVLPLSTLYMQIYFVGMPFNLLYNFGASVMRACGDTKRPLIFLACAGIGNVGLNLLLVIVFRMSVAGVAVATVVAQAISAILVVIWLRMGKRYPKLYFAKLRIHKREFIEIVKIGLPAGIQGTIFSLSNVVIQSSINGFKELAMAGNTVASSVEGFVYVSMNAVSQSCLTFVGQNYGADKHENIHLVLGQCILIVTVVGVVLGGLAYIFGEFLCGIYNKNPEVMAYGAERLLYTCVPYCLCGIMEVLVGALRGLGHSFMPMTVSVVGVCGLRIVWVYTAFAAVHTLPMLYLSYPVSWAITALVHFICYIFISRKEIRGMRRRREQKEIMLSAQDETVKEAVI